MPGTTENSTKKVLCSRHAGAIFPHKCQEVGSGQFCTHINKHTGSSHRPEPGQQQGGWLDTWSRRIASVSCHSLKSKWIGTWTQLSVWVLVQDPLSIPGSCCNISPSLNGFLVISDKKTVRTWSISEGSNLGQPPGPSGTTVKGLKASVVEEELRVSENRKTQHKSFLPSSLTVTQKTSMTWN